MKHIENMTPKEILECTSQEWQEALAGRDMLEILRPTSTELFGGIPKRNDPKESLFVLEGWFFKRLQSRGENAVRLPKLRVAAAIITRRNIEDGIGPYANSKMARFGLYMMLGITPSP